MTTYTPSFEIKRASPRKLLNHAWSINKPLTALIVLCALLTVLGAIGMILDPRTLTGAPIWTKPTKFSISIVIYCATIFAFFSSIQPRPRWVNWVFNLTAATLFVEMVVIGVQAARGQTSHYNMTTALNAAMWSAMGISIYILFTVSILGAILLTRQRLSFGAERGARTLVWSVKLGMIVTVLAGFGVANFMVVPSESQMEALVAGEEGATSIIGAHTVGAEDGGAGLPFVGWSTTHGDYRPAHFFGLHALQAIPLLGLFIARRRESWLAEGHRLSMIVIASLTYAGFVALMTWQAMRAEPLIYPSAETLIALVTLLGTALIATGVTVIHAQRSR